MLCTAIVVLRLALSVVECSEVTTGEVVAPVLSNVDFLLILSGVVLSVNAAIVVKVDDGLSLETKVVLPIADVTGDILVTVLFADITPGVVAVNGTRALGVVTIKEQ